MFAELVRRLGHCSTILIPTKAEHIDACYTTYSDELCPLANFTAIPEDLVVETQPNGDMALCDSAGHEPTFDVVGVVVDSCLEAPVGFPKFVTCTMVLSHY